MTHCSSCSYAGNYYRAPPPDLATHLGRGAALHFCTSHSQQAPHGPGRGAVVPHSLHPLLSSGGHLILWFSGTRERTKVKQGVTG